VNKKSLGIKFFTATLFTTVSALLLSSALIVAYTLHDYGESVEKELSSQSSVIARAVTPALQFQDPESAQTYLSLMDEQSSVLEAAIYDAKGAVFARYASPENTFPQSNSLPEYTGVKKIGDSIVIYKRIVANNEILGIVFVRMRYDIFTKLLTISWISFLSILMALIFVLTFAVRHQKKIVGPILQISHLAKRLVETRDYSLRAKKTSDDEIGYLVDAFNEMLGEVAKQRSELEASNESLVREVDERKEAEVALKKSEENVLNLNAELEQRVINRTHQLEIANSELEAFSYSVSHDLRSPLRAIDGFSQALIEDYEQTLDDTGKDYLNRVRSAAQRMGSLIDDMLKLSKVNRAEMTISKIDLSDMAKTILQELGELEPDRRVQCAVTSGITAYCDQHLIRIALANLIGNAWKYSSPQAQGRIEFGMRLNGNDAAYFVQDNGVGFDMKYSEKLFSAFQRLHSQHEFQGTGIGLATVKRVISRHGGRVWAESTPGQGATFYFTLPMDDQLQST